MATAQVALTGLTRCFSFIKDKHDSNSSFYSSTVDRIKEIRDLSSQVALLANEALARVGQDVVDVQVASRDELNVKSDAVLAEIADIKAQLAKIVDSPQNKIEDSVNIEQNEIPANSGSELLTKSNQLDKRVTQECSQCDEVKSKQLPKPVIKHFIRDFKRVTNTLESIPEDRFSSPEVCRLGRICSQYFQKRYTKNSHCVFKVEDYRNYLLSFIIGYSRAYLDDKTSEYLEECSNWIRSLEFKNSKYTLPKPVAFIYFNQFNEKTKKPQCYISDDCMTVTQSIWNEFWLLGYNQFESLNYDFLPDSDLSWAEITTNTLSEVNDEIWHNGMQEEFDMLVHQWKLIHKFKIHQYRCIDFHIEYQFETFEFEQAVLSYVKRHGVGSIKDLQTRLDNIFPILEHAEFELKDEQEKQDYINSYPAESLELLDVIDEYVFSWMFRD